MTSEVNKIKEDAIDLMKSTISALESASVDSEVGLVVSLSEMALSLMDKKLVKIILK